MGYNRRAINLQRAARVIMEKHGEGVPRDPRVLETLPGIGRYTAAAIACFAFRRPVAVMDTNIRRVLGRVLDRPQATCGRGDGVGACGGGGSAKTGGGHRRGIRR